MAGRLFGAVKKGRVGYSEANAAASAPAASLAGPALSTEAVDKPVEQF